MSMYAELVTPKISNADESEKPDPSDKLNCNLTPLPKGCPMVDMDGGQVKFSWAKVVHDPNGKRDFKVVTTPAQRVRSGAKGTDSHRLLREITFFSFEHGNADKLVWDPEVESKSSSLPRDLKSEAPHSV